uniref:Uncharacterized protein n=1 Tax=Arundo donax TaxID=35708 RepID=A0A0A8YIV0_ARUDO
MYVTMDHLGTSELFKFANLVSVYKPVESAMMYAQT